MNPFPTAVDIVGNAFMHSGDFGTKSHCVSNHFLWKSRKRKRFLAERMNPFPTAVDIVGNAFMHSGDFETKSHCNNNHFLRKSRKRERFLAERINPFPTYTTPLAHFRARGVVLILPG